MPSGLLLYDGTGRLQFTSSDVLLKFHSVLTLYSASLVTQVFPISGLTNPSEWFYESTGYYVRCSFQVGQITIQYVGANTVVIGKKL